MDDSFSTAAYVSFCTAVHAHVDDHIDAHVSCCTAVDAHVDDHADDHVTFCTAVNARADAHVDAHVSVCTAVDAHVDAHVDFSVCTAADAHAGAVWYFSENQQRTKTVSEPSSETWAAAAAARAKVSPPFLRSRPKWRHPNSSISRSACSCS